MSVLPSLYVILLLVSDLILQCITANILLSLWCISRKNPQPQSVKSAIGWYFLFLQIFMSKRSQKREKLRVAIANMDINRLPNEQKLDLCRWYFRVGMFMLPFVWAVNTVWFFQEAFVKPAYEEQKKIKKYVIASGIGCLLWSAILGAWVVIYQTKRVSWEATMGDFLGFITPLGRP